MTGYGYPPRDRIALLDGRFLLDPCPGPVPSLPARRVAVTLAGQAGAALDTAGPMAKDG
ncbi:hypothetical protein [Streptomyces inhibens]|uniref:hypothetical protein n=1 Tax=Streptomyces inhibens TaxID=2293571 RepID=UPI001EE6DAED|nr:hypothetical protein [Streptomyces inhibens]UKY47531.1 hypothetical protein KI385_00800 [Streptomyces inhibens]